MSTLKVNNVTDLGDDAVITDGALVGAGKILQVVSTTKTDTFTSASSTLTDITGLAVSITPSSTSSKILILSTVIGSQKVGVDRAFLRLMRDSTPIFVGDSADNRSRFSGGFSAFATTLISSSTGSSFLDSPNTTASVTYKWQGVTPFSGGLFINRTDNDPDEVQMGRFASSITVMEVAG